MLFTSAALALVSLIPALIEASPIQKRLTGQTIVAPNGQCLSLPAGTGPNNNVALITVNCLIATKWDLNVGTPSSILVSGTGFALDAGVPQQNGNFAKVYQSYPGSPQQTWYVTADNRIAVFQGTECLDLDATRGPQTWQCTTGNTNQVWKVVGGSAPPPSSSVSSAAPSSTSIFPSSRSSAAPSSTSSTAPPSPTGTSIRWKSDTTKCVTLQGTPGNGVLVNMATCADSNSKMQRWTLNNGGVIQLADTTYGAFCLDLGTSPANGVQMKVWQCYPGSPQQTWNYTPSGTGMIKNSPSNQCLNINNQGNTMLQTWDCSTNGDPQEQFVLAN